MIMPVFSINCIMPGMPGDDCYIVYNKVLRQSIVILLKKSELIALLSADPFKIFSYSFFIAVVRRLIKDLVRHRIREILLLHIVVRIIVGVFVSGTVALELTAAFSSAVSLIMYVP